jgi:hypothetical protein
VLLRLHLKLPQDCLYLLLLLLEGFLSRERVVKETKEDG